ncbi:MAG: CvpA family protein [Eubacteriales bacterium]|nr:CvpA family protein [Eubacteriales bacterium]
MNFTWLGIVTALILVFLTVWGYRRGFIKELFSLMFIFLSLVIVWFINPYVNQFLRENTSIKKTIEKNLDTYVESQMAEQEEVKEAKTETELINGLILPENIKKGLIKNNNSDAYKFLSAETMTEYIKDYLTESIVNGISFLLSFILASLLIRILAYVLDILSRLPIIHGANKILGAMFGCTKGIVFVWIVLLAVTVLCNTEIGKTALKLVNQDSFLTMLNKYNVFVKVFMNIFYGGNV